MRHVTFLASLFLLASAALSPAVADTATPPHILFLGTVNGSGHTGEKGCGTPQPTASTFIRNGAGPAKRQVDALEVNYDEEPFVKYGGLAILAFETNNSGTLRFDISPRGLPAGRNPLHFSDYQQHYNPQNGVLRITFSLDFGHCVAPIYAVYRPAD